jgi:choline-sulfatase
MLGLRPTTTGIYGLAPWFRNVEEWKGSRHPAAAFQGAWLHLHVYGGKIYHGGSAAQGPRAEFDVWGPGGRRRRQAAEKKLIPPTPMGNHPLMDWGVFPHATRTRGLQGRQWAVEQLKDAPKDQPFFSRRGFFLPHVPCYATQKWFDLYPDDDSVLPPVLEDDRDDTPRFSWYLHWNCPSRG